MELSKPFGVVEFPTARSKNAPFHPWYGEDGGRLMGAGSAVITADPDSDRLNVGPYPMMTLGGREALLAITPGKQRWRILGASRYGNSGGVP